MAGRTAIPIQELPNLGQATLTWTPADASNGMSFLNDGNTILQVRNEGATSATVTVESVADSNGRKGDIVITLGAEASGATDNVIASTNLLPTSLFNPGGGNICNVDFSAGAAGLSVCCLRLQPRR